MIGVVFPSSFESADLLNQMTERVAARPEKYCATWLGKLEGQEIAVGVVGMGPPHCASRTESFIEFYQLSHLILAGYAGALDPALKRGEVFINRGQGKIHTARDVIATAEDKARLLAETGAPLVDMESDFIAEVAQKHDLPLTVIRAVSDLASESVPVDILQHSYDQEKGVTTPFRLGLHLAVHWGDIPRLMRFLKPLSGVRRALTSVVVKEVAKLAEE
ncbi:hypothetical protein [Cerasicoccus fimbriatus]|uniref:phosphorylase family protein n=1 Tax=Cerasicoccus fimbriatus TaxID=3014554 RepID=UPI0022B424F8|nr:hypothetical protein [Cerasicoccus sp. TK19100]